MKTILGVIVVATVAGIALLGACGGGGEEGTSDPGGGEMQIATYAYTRTPITDWDPAAEFAEGTLTLQNVYESLLRYDPIADEFEPILATDYERSEDGKTWTFTIREGVKFHDGTDLDAEAVKYSIERTIELGKGAAFIWGPVEEINVLDPYTVEFKLKYSAPLDLISASAYAAYIVSPTAAEANPDDWFTQGNEAGTGPYMLESWKTDQEVVLTKFPDYWGGWEGKHFDKVVLQTVSESATKRQMVTKGDADVTMELPPEDLEALQNDPNVEVVRAPSFQNLWFMMNTQREPMDNVKVRQAMSYAFPYADVVDFAMGGLAAQSRGPVPAGLWGHGDEVPQYTYDIEKAKQLMAEAGYADRTFKVEFTYASGDEAQRKAAELWKAELAKIGIDLEIRSGPWMAVWNRAKSQDPAKRQGVFSLYWWPDVADPYSFLYSPFHSEKEPVYNLSYWSNKRVDELIDEGAQIAGVDREKAAQLYIEAQTIIVEEAPTVFLFDVEYGFVLNKSFQGFKSNPAYARVVWFYDCYRE